MLHHNPRHHHHVAADRHVVNTLDETMTPTSSEDHHGFTITVNIPRFHAEDISFSVSTERNELIVNGKPNQQSQQELAADAEFGHLSAPREGFRHSFHVDAAKFDLNDTRASIELGVLTLFIPRSHQKTPLPRHHAADRHHATADSVAVADGSFEHEETSIEQSNQITDEQHNKVSHGPVTIFNGHRSNDALLPDATRMEVSDLRHCQWPPIVRVTPSTEGLVYRCFLPPSVLQDHIHVQLDGNVVTLTVQYTRRVKTSASDYAENALYTTNWNVPEGTAAENVRTSYSCGLLSVVVKQ